MIEGLPPETSAMLITLINAFGSTIIFKLKSYQNKAAASKRRADAVCEAVDEARADGEITPQELKRIIKVASKASGA